MYCNIEQKGRCFLTACIIETFVCENFWIAERQKTLANISLPNFFLSSGQAAHSFLMLLTTALVNGEALSVVYELIFATCVLE